MIDTDDNDDDSKEQREIAWLCFVARTFLSAAACKQAIACSRLAGKRREEGNERQDPWIRRSGEPPQKRSRNRLYSSCGPFVIASKKTIIVTLSYREGHILYKSFFHEGQL